MFLPEQFKSIFVYFHGGGLDRGAKGGMEKIANYLATKGIATASVNYRLYANPNFPDRTYTPAKYPDFIRDVALSVAFVKDYMQKNYGSINIYVGGSSAGGYLSIFDHVVMHGKHIEYVKKSQADDDCVIFGEMIYDFINKVESK